MGTGGRQIAKAAVIVMALFALSRLLGVVRQMAIAAQFGTSGDLDAYMAAARERPLPDEFRDRQRGPAQRPFRGRSGGDRVRLAGRGPGERAL